MSVEKSEIEIETLEINIVHETINFKNDHMYISSHTDFIKVHTSHF